MEIRKLNNGLRFVPLVTHARCRELEAINLGSQCRIHGSPGAAAPPTSRSLREDSVEALCRSLNHWHHCPELYKAIEGIRYIADHTKREEDSTRVWKKESIFLFVCSFVFAHISLRFAFVNEKFFVKNAGRYRVGIFVSTFFVGTSSVKNVCFKFGKFPVHIKSH